MASTLRNQQTLRVTVELFLSSHPGPVVAVTLAATGYAIAQHRGAIGIVLVALAVLLGQLCIGWHNDFLDVERDANAQRTDKPVASGRIATALVRNSALAAGIVTIPLSLASGWRAGLVHLVAVGFGLSYNSWLRRTVFSFVPFFIAFALLTCFVTLGGIRHPLPPWWIAVDAGALGVAAHFLNVLPDREIDLANDIRGLPQRLPRTVALIASGFVLFAASAVVAFGSRDLDAFTIAGLGLATVLVVLAIYRAKTSTTRQPFQLVLLVALVDVAMLIAKAR